MKRHGAVGNKRKDSRSDMSDFWHKYMDSRGDDDGVIRNKDKSFHCGMSECHRGLHNCATHTDSARTCLTYSWVGTGPQKNKDETLRLRLFEMSLGCFAVDNISLMRSTKI